MMIAAAATQTEIWHQHINRVVDVKMKEVALFCLCMCVDMFISVVSLIIRDATI
jgi:hypothetical protein